VPMNPTSQAAIQHVLSLLQVKAVSCGKERIGGAHDGGYVMASKFSGGSIAYSIGVGPQIQWDRAMAERGFSIFQYDHTVEGLPEQHELFNYFRLGIAPQDTPPDLITLEEMIRRNGHTEETGMILKMDVEGAEWDVFDAIDPAILRQFDQIVVEFHGLRLLEIESFRDRAERVFSKLVHHHSPVHIHGNNYADYAIVEGVPIPDVIEVLYCRRDRFDFEPSHEVFPTALDDPCDPNHPDLFLGSFRFKRIAA